MNPIQDPILTEIELCYTSRRLIFVGSTCVVVDQSIRKKKHIKNK